MNCKDVSELSSLFLSRELDSARTGELRKHLENCRSCAAEIDQLRQIDVRVRDAVFSESVDASQIEDNVRQAIAAPSRRWMGAAASIAAAIVIGGIGFRLWSAPNRTCVEAAGDHKAEVVNGARRTWRADPASIAELADRQGISYAAVARLSGAGFDLERGKLCRLDGRIYLHLVYSNGAEKVSVFLRQRDSGSANPIRTAEALSENVAYFDTDRVSALVVAHKSPDAATQLARHAKQVL